MSGSVRAGHRAPDSLDQGAQPHRCSMTCTATVLTHPLCRATKTQVPDPPFPGTDSRRHGGLPRTVRGFSIEQDSLPFAPSSPLHVGTLACNCRKEVRDSVEAPHRAPCRAPCRDTPVGTSTKCSTRSAARRAICSEAKSRNRHRDLREHTSFREPRTVSRCS